MGLRRFIEQVKRFDELGWLSRVLLEHQTRDVSLKGVLAVTQNLGKSVSVLERGWIELQNVNSVHLLNVVGNLFEFNSVQLEVLARQMRALSHKLIRFPCLLILQHFLEIVRLNNSPHC